MKDLMTIANDVSEKMAEIEKKRDTVLRGSKDIIRLTKRVIHSIHSGGSYENDLNLLREEMHALMSAASEDPFTSCMGALEDAMAEYAETLMLCSILERSEFPSFETLRITPQAWMLGLADCLGELRRVLLKDLMRSDMDHASDIFDEMERLTDVIMTFDVPESIVPIRRKQDIARGIMERTRTDMTTAVVMRGIRS